MASSSPQTVFNRKDIQNFRRRASSDFSSYAFLARKTAERLHERLSDIRRTYELAILNGPCSNLDHPAITKSFRLNDGWEADMAASDELVPTADRSIQLFLSNLTLHSVNDLPGMLAQINRTLAPDGLFMAAMFGGETLRELRESMIKAEIATRGGASPRVFPFADKQQIGALLQRTGFALPVVDSEIITVTYNGLDALMHDLRGMGESNAIEARDRRNPGKAFFKEAGRIYRELYADTDKRLPATFEIIYLIGWGPHESQQKPLKPGSAQTRLSDVLDTVENKFPVR